MTGPGPAPVPRPGSARPGDPAPWAGLDPPPDLSLTDVRGAVGGRSAPTAGEGRDSPTAASAVLVPLFGGADGPRVVLTRRATTLTRHSGQVAFPGGRAEPGESLVAAALREAWEEVGLAPADVEIVGELSPVLTVSTGLTVHPFVGVVPAPPVLVPDPAEVARVFDVGLAELLADGVYREELWPGPSGERRVWFFDVAGETVWGVTAAVLRELLCTALAAAGRHPVREFC